MIKPRRVTAIALAFVTLTSCVSCSSINKKTEIMSYPLVDALSKREVIDYYTQEMKVASVARREPVSTSSEGIAYRGVDDAEMPKLEAELLRAETMLSKGVYENDKYVTPQLWGYMKSSLDDYVLRREKVAWAGASKEFYILDVEYSLKLKNEGSLKEDAQYLGVHGAFVQDTLGRDYLDSNYVGLLNAALSNEAEKNRIKAGTGAISYQELQDKQIEKGSLKLSPNTATVPSPPENSETMDSTDAPAETPAVQEARDLNISIVNSVLGGVLKTTAYVPDLSLIFVPSAAQGNLSGFGIYGQANHSLKNQFGINPQSLDGTAVVRYVFRSEISNNQVVHLDNVYVKSIGIDGLPGFDELSVFPQFVQVGLSAALDRADRLKMNNDAAGFMNGNVYSNIRVGILAGYARNSVINHRTVTDVSKNDNDDYNGFLQRKDNFWLVRATSNVLEEAKYAAAGSSTSRETWLVSLHQNGEDFVIDDTLLINKELTKEADMNAESNLNKRYSRGYLKALANASQKESNLCI
ncbi:hypothetical protein AGMMS49975_27080 [Clostridia bacterium]|nr:hypothetical protein AGMMS49975_27080 [Clostridia bacterium]